MSTLTDDMKSLDPRDNAGFRKVLVRAQGELGLDDMECAVLFDVSRPSVTNWRKGVTFPAPVVCKVALEELRKVLEKQEPDV